MLAIFNFLISTGLVNPLALVKVALPYVNEKVDLANELLSDRFGVKKVFLIKLLGLENYLDGVSEAEFQELLSLAKEAVVKKLDEKEG